MLNYIKSEFYRIFHGKEIYALTAVFSGLAVLVNVILYLFGRYTKDFQYGNIWYSLNNLSANMSILLLSGMLVTAFLFSDEYKNGTVKNVVSFGISRIRFFTGKCIVCALASVAIMVVVLSFFIGSSYLLLEGAGDITVLVRLKGVAANLPMAFASVILTVALLCLIKKESIVAIVWVVIMSCIPIFCFFMGLKIGWLEKVAEWMPWNYLKYEVNVNMSQYECLWDTPEGLAKCLIAGVAGMVIFYLLGVVGFRRKEIS